MAVAAPIVRRTLFAGELMHICHVSARPASPAEQSLESQPCNVLVLPLAGVFAKHEGPRRRFIATANHAVLIAADQPYRVSFPGAIGDRCLSLRLSGAALARVLPEAAVRDGFDLAAFATHALLPPRAMLARSLLWHCLARGEADPLYIEELGVTALAAALEAARLGSTPRRDVSCVWRNETQNERQIERVKEAISVVPEHKWTLAALAELAGMTPFHLAHVFRREVAESVYRYVLRARLARALEAVLGGDGGLTEIALDAGFTSHSHFTARFRALFGVTPHELRRVARRTSLAALRKIVTARSVAPS
jgi:AraC family transcriptional regulator